MGVYLLLSALDFPFCFLAVRLLGTERIGQAEKAVINAFWRVVEVPFPNARKGREQASETIEEAVGDSAAREGSGWGVEEAQIRNRGEEASMLLRLCVLDLSRQATNSEVRSYNSTLAGICDSQVFHLRSDTVDCGRDTKGCQDVEGLGLEYWQEEAESALRRSNTVGAVTYLYKNTSRLGASIEGLGEGWPHSLVGGTKHQDRPFPLQIVKPFWHLDHRPHTGLHPSPTARHQAW